MSGGKSQMSAMSELDARLREMGTPYPDDEGDLWVMVGPDQFRYVVLSKQGAVMRLGENVLTGEQVGTLTPIY
jgi:hypothetical protein